MTALANLFGTLLKAVYDFIGHYGAAIIIFTIIVKLALLPLTIKQTKSMKKMNEVQPKIKELQEKYKNDKETLSKKTMELYQEYNVNPFAGCLPLVIQFPVIIGLFTALRNPGIHVFESQAAYDAISKSFLWIPNLAEVDPWILPIVAAVTTYLTTLTTPSNDQSAKTMQYMMPVMIFAFSKGLIGPPMPAGLVLYWSVSNLLQYVQQLLITKPFGQKGGTA